MFSIFTGTNTVVFAPIEAGVWSTPSDPPKNGATYGVTDTVCSAILMPFPENHVTPSCTRSHRRMYVPAAFGNARFACTWVSWPAGTSAGSFVRSPSHTTVLPPLVSQ